MIDKSDNKHVIFNTNKSIYGSMGVLHADLPFASPDAMVPFFAPQSAGRPRETAHWSEERHDHDQQKEETLHWLVDMQINKYNRSF